MEQAFLAFQVPVKKDAWFEQDDKLLSLLVSSSPPRGTTTLHHTSPCIQQALADRHACLGDLHKLKCKKHCSSIHCLQSYFAPKLSSSLQCLQPVRDAFNECNEHQRLLWIGWEREGIEKTKQHTKILRDNSTQITHTYIYTPHT